MPLIGDGHGQRAAATLMNRFDGGRAERRGLVRGDDPDLAVRSGDDHPVITERDDRALWQLDETTPGDGGGVDRGDTTRTGLEDVVAGLDDVEILPGGGDLAVDLSGVYVDSADEPAVLVRDPDAAVGDVDLGGGQTRMGEGEARQHQRDDREDRRGHDGDAVPAAPLRSRSDRHGRTPSTSFSSQRADDPCPLRRLRGPGPVARTPCPGYSWTAVSTTESASRHTRGPLPRLTPCHGAVLPAARVRTCARPESA